MRVVKKSIHKYVNRCFCDECKEGELIWIHHNKVESGQPTLYIHRCEGCGATELIEGHCYPEIIEQEDGEEPIVQVW